jgi:hypothetical protein
VLFSCMSRIIDQDRRACIGWKNRFSSIHGVAHNG